MKDVLRHVTAQNFESALVRLWTMAEGARLNKWEMSNRMRQLKSDTDDFAALLFGEREITVESLELAPIAFICALDNFMVAIKTSQQAFKIPYTEDGNNYWILPVDLKGRANASLPRQRGSRAHWFKRHAIVPTKTLLGKFNVSVSVARMGLAEKLGAMAKADASVLKFWIGHFDDSCCVSWDAALSVDGRFRAVSLDDNATRGKSIVATLEAAKAAGAQIVVLPELSVDLTHRKHLEAHLASMTGSELLLVLAGSFHETHEEKCYNTAPLLDALTGDIVLKPRKLRAFGVTGDPENSVAEQAEHIDVGDTVDVLVTELGNITVLICKDFLDADQSVSTLLQEIPVDWVLVPSYGDKKTFDGHMKKAKEVSVVTIGANVIVANIRNINTSQGDCLPGFAWPSGQKEDPTPVAAVGGLVCVKVGEISPRPIRPVLKRVK